MGEYGSRRLVFPHASQNLPTYPQGCSETTRLTRRFETVKGIYLTMKPFPEEVLTPTLKLKR